MGRNRLALIAIAATFLAACSTSDIVISGYGAGGLPYHPSYVRYMLGQGDIPLEVHGNPSTLGDEAFVELVEKRLRLDPAFGRATFRTNPTTKNHHPFRVVLVFNADNTRIDPNHVCRGEGVENSGGVNTTLHVRGVFCDRETVLSANSGLANTPDDFNSKRFGLLLDQLLFEMMPAEGNRDLDENCPTTANC